MGGGVKQNTCVGEEDNSQSELNGVTQVNAKNASMRVHCQRIVGH